MPGDCWWPWYPVAKAKSLNNMTFILAPYTKSVRCAYQDDGPPNQNPKYVCAIILLPATCAPQELRAWVLQHIWHSPLNAALWVIMNICVKVHQSIFYRRDWSTAEQRIKEKWRNNNNLIKQDCLSVEHRPCECVCDLDLDLDPMTLILDLDLNVLNMYLHTENKGIQMLESEIYKSAQCQQMANLNRTQTCLLCSCNLLWPWPHDLDIRKWPRCSEYIPACQKLSFWATAQTGQTLTDWQTNAIEYITTPPGWRLDRDTATNNVRCRLQRFAHSSINPLKPSGAKWLHLRVSRAILV